jgi:hypothetical protein
MIATTFRESGSMPLSVMPYLHPREIDGVLDAIDDGDLVAIVDSREHIHTPEIVALARPELADEIVRRDTEVITELREALKQARKELTSTRDIVREVFAEKEPGDHVWRIESALDDVKSELESATDYAEEL